MSITDQFNNVDRISKVWLGWVLATFICIILATFLPGIGGKIFIYISIIIFFVFCLILMSGNISIICKKQSAQSLGITCEDNTKTEGTKIQAVKYILPVILFSYTIMQLGITMKTNGKLGMSFTISIFASVLLLTLGIVPINLIPNILQGWIRGFRENKGGGGEEGEEGEEGDGGNDKGSGGLFGNMFKKKQLSKEKLTRIAADRDYKLEEKIKADQKEEEEASGEGAEQQEIEMTEVTTQGADAVPDGDGAGSAAATAAADGAGDNTGAGDTTKLGGGLFGKSKTPLQEAKDELTKDENLANLVIGAQKLKEGETEITDLTVLNKALGITSIESLPDKNEFKGDFIRNITAQAEAPSDTKLKMTSKFKSAATSVKKGVSSAATSVKKGVSSAATSVRERLKGSKDPTSADTGDVEMRKKDPTSADTGDGGDGAGDNAGAVAKVGGGRRKTKSARRTLRKKLIPGGVL